LTLQHRGYNPASAAEGEWVVVYWLCATMATGATLGARLLDSSFHFARTTHLIEAYTGAFFFIYCWLWMFAGDGVSWMGCPAKPTALKKLAGVRRGQFLLAGQLFTVLNI
jgi:hypothetical protein